MNNDVNTATHLSVGAMPVAMETHWFR